MLLKYTCNIDCVFVPVFVTCSLAISFGDIIRLKFAGLLAASLLHLCIFSCINSCMYMYSENKIWPIIIVVPIKVR